MAPADEVLVQLVARRVRDTGRDGERLAAERAHEQEPEHRVLAEVGDLAQDEIPSTETRAEVGHGREPEDQPGPEDDGQPVRSAAVKSHRRPMIGSRPIGER